GRLFETEQLLKFLEDTKGPLIVVADLNDTPDGGAYKLLRTSFADAGVAGRAKGDGVSYPADKPGKSVEYIFDRGAVLAEQAVVETLASDHVPVVAELEIR